MTTVRHTTIIGADVSDYLAAKARQQAADDAHGAAAKRLAAMLSDAERERIAAMAASESAAKQAAAVQRDRIHDTRQALALIRAEQNEIRQTIALHRQEAEAVRRTAAEREAGFARAERAAEKYNATLAKQRAAQSAGAGSGSMVAGGLAAAGGAAAGVGLAVAGVKMGLDLTNQLVESSYKAQSVSRNLQIDIRGARDAMGGLVSDYDLAFAANKAYAMKVVTTGDEFAHLAGMIGEQATKLGRDAGELISEGVEAIGKQESEIADNLGVTMRLTDAYALYAEQLDKSVSSLTAKEKAEAFNKAMIIALEQATGRATVGVEGFTAAWKKAGVEVDNFRGRFEGFTDMHGRANEALRELSDEQLDRLKFAEALNDEDAKRMDAMGRTAREMQGHIDDWGLSIMDLKAHADTMGVSYLQMLEDAKAAHAAQFDTDVADTLAIAQQETLDILHEQADAQEHTGKLMQIMGASEREILEHELQILEARQMAMLTQAAITKDAKDEAAAKKITQEIELTHAKIEMIGKGKGGKKRDPNEQLDMETAATLRLLDARQKIYTAELDGERDLENVAASKMFLLSLDRQALDVREEAANARKVTGAKDIDKRDAELLEIATERRLLDVEAQKLVREEGRRHAEERIAEMDREIEKQASLGVATGLLERRRTDAHASMVAEFGGTEELRQAEHDQEMERREADRAYAVSLEQERLDAFTRETDLAQARGEQIYDIASQRLELEASIAAAEGDHDRQRQLLHQREVARIEERKAKLQRATQNANAMIGQSAAVFDMVTGYAIKNEKKREKAALRARGVEAIARAALETVESVAAFASLNVPQGILHATAAGIGYTTGFAMIAGVEPGGGKTSAASGGGAGHQTVISQPDSSGSGSGSSSSGSPTTPPSAEELINLRNRQSSTTGMTPAKGGTVININAPIISGDAGTILHDMSKQTLKKWGAK